MNNSNTHRRLRVGIHTATLGGGYGDLAVGVKLAYALNLSANFDVRVYIREDFFPSLQLFAAQLRNIPVVSYSRGKRDERTLEFEHPPRVDGKEVKWDEDVMIFVHSSARDDKGLLGEAIAIELAEYSSGVRETNLEEGRIGISTGLSFDPNKKAVQAGLVYSRQFTSLLERAKTERNAMLQQCEQVLQEQLGRTAPDLKNHPFGLYYVSTLLPRYAYFDILAEAAQYIDHPITIIAPVGGRHKDTRLTMAFEEKMADLEFNYVTHGQAVDRGSKVTVVNPPDIPSGIFQLLIILSTLPMTATGDQSLSEAIQKASSDTPSPFLIYTLESKQPDFLDLIHKIDPYIAMLLSSYYRHELSEGVRKRILESEYIRERLEPYLVSPLLREAEIARLFYDQSVIARFNAAMAAIPSQMIMQRQGYVPYPDDLYDATKTIEIILEGIRTKNLGLIKDFIPHGR